MYKILKYFVKRQVISCYKLLEKGQEPELSYILVKIFKMCLKEYCFPDCWKDSSMVPVFENLRERPTAKNYHLVSLFSVVSKIFEKLANNKLIDNLEKYGLFISFSVLGLLNQIKNFWPFVSFHKCRGIHIGLNLMSYVSLCVRCSAYFPLFSVIDAFKWFWMASLHKNIQIMLNFRQPPSLIFHFYYYTLLTFLILLPVIFQSMLMTPLSRLSVIKMVHLICGNKLIWLLLNLNLINKTLQWGKK